MMTLEERAQELSDRWYDYLGGPFKQSRAELALLIAEALRTVRREALEEAAKVADLEAEMARANGALDISQEYTAPLRVAAAIRSLGKPTGGAA